MQASYEIIEPKLFAGAVADEIVASMSESISERGRCSLVLAGGSTPSTIYRTIAKPPRVEEVDWSKVNIYWGDERWVSKDDNQSNFKMVQETLLAHLPHPGPRVHAVNTSLPTPQEAARVYAQTISKEEGLDGSSGPVFDVVLLGVGEDGHTASLFPQSPLLKESSQTICEAVAHPADGKPRITLTPEALFSARHILFIVKGEGKADTIKRILEGGDSPVDVPARLYERASDRVTWFLDSGAGQKLVRK